MPSSTSSPKETFHQYRAARKFHNVSPLLRWSIAHGLLDTPTVALDFGAGLLVEATKLIELGWKVDALETRQSVEARRDMYSSASIERNCRVITGIEATRRQYKLITVTHVLEFVPDPRERRSLLRALGQRLTSRGLLLLSLRGWPDVRAAKHLRREGDGFVTGLGTWTRGYTVAEASELVSRSGLSIVTSPAGPRAKSPEQVRLVCRSNPTKKR